MRLIKLFSLLIALLFFTFCSSDNKDLNSLEESVRTPLYSITDEIHPIYEDDLFSLNGKKVFSECDLRQNPEVFNGKILRIKTNYGFMIHGSYFSDSEKCVGVKNSIHEAISVGFQSKKDFDYIDKMNEIPISIIAVGKFSVKTPTHQSDTIYDNTPFDFEIISLEKAERIRK